jgi:hypothetical protein
VGLKVFYSLIKAIPDGVPVSQCISRGFMVLALFFLGLLVFELFSVEAMGVPAMRKEQSKKYWIVLAVQAGVTIFLRLSFIFLRTENWRKIRLRGCGA